MNKFVTKLFPTWLNWVAFVFTVCGVLYSIGNNLPWIGFLSLLPFTIAAVQCAKNLNSENQNITLQLQNSLTDLEKMRQTAQNFSREAYLRFEEIAIRGSYQESFEALYGYVDYISRLQQLNLEKIDLRNVIVHGESVYAAFKINNTAGNLFKIGDPFILFSLKSGLNHPVARFRVHQINYDESSVFLELVDQLDDEIVNSLKILSQNIRLSELKQFKFSPEGIHKPFAGENLLAATKVLSILREQISSIKDFEK